MKLLNFSLAAAAIYFVTAPQGYAQRATRGATDAAARADLVRRVDEARKYFSDAKLIIDTTNTTAVNARSTIMRGRLAPSSNMDVCLLNPSAIAVTRGATQTIENGSLVFRGSGSSPLEVVIAVPAVAQDFPAIPEIVETGGSLTFVLDRIDMKPGSEPTSQYGVADRFYDIRAIRGGFTLLPRQSTEDLVVCPDFDTTVSEIDGSIIAAERSRSAAWVSYASEKNSDSDGQLHTASTSELSLADLSFGSGDSAAYSAIAVQQAQAWSTVFRREENRWDRCYAVPTNTSGAIRLRCSNIGFVAEPEKRGILGDVWSGIGSAFSFFGHIFDSRPSGHVRVTFLSEPANAGIFFGPLEQRGRTAKSLDVTAEQLESAHFEKSGYTTCGYRAWKKKRILGARDAMTVSCTLKRAQVSGRR